MTTEPRQEAEQIAAWHGAEWAAAHRGEDNDLAGSTDRLVDALAAAIEVVQGWDIDGSGKHTGKAVTELRGALSALREDET